MAVMFSAWDQGTYEVRFERKQCGLFWFCLIFLSFCIVANAYSALFPFKPHFVGCLIPGTTHHCHPFKCRMSTQIDSIGVSGDKKGLHWYQWYDWYQWKSTLFQWFCWWICISLRGLRWFSDVVCLGTGQFRWSIGTNGKAPYSNGSIGDYASH